MLRNVRSMTSLKLQWERLRVAEMEMKSIHLGVHECVNCSLERGERNKIPCNVDENATIFKSRGVEDDDTGRNFTGRLNELRESLQPTEETLVSGSCQCGRACGRAAVVLHGGS